MERCGLRKKNKVNTEQTQIICSIFKEKQKNRRKQLHGKKQNNEDLRTSLSADEIKIRNLPLMSDKNPQFAVFIFLCFDFVCVTLLKRVWLLRLFSA